MSEIYSYPLARTANPHPNISVPSEYQRVALNDYSPAGPGPEEFTPVEPPAGRGWVA